MMAARTGGFSSWGFLSWGFSIRISLHSPVIESRVYHTVAAQKHSPEFMRLDN